jgi:branched-chain amino acid transport system ATP-binding protein
MKSLKVEEIHTFYGLSHILFGVSLSVDKGETVCLLGRNGAGKTTTLKSIMGLAQPRSGRILFEDEDITGKLPHVVARRGIGFVPEDRRIFPDLTVRANLEVAKKPSVAGSQEWNLERVYNLFGILRERESQAGGMLSGGEQQMLTIARSLMGNPQLLLIDEPSEGLSPLIVKVLREQIIQLQREKITMLLVEQNADFALEVSNRTYILKKGTVHYTGSASELIEDQETRKKYLGV